MFSSEKKDGLKFFVDDYGLMLSRSENWDTNPTHGIGDALYRTALFYIIYPNEKRLKQAIMSCFIVEKGVLTIKRHPTINESNVSRDQIAAALIALKINGDIDELSFILNNLPIKLSNKAFQTLDFYLWQKSLLGSKTFSFLFCLLTYLIFLFVVPFNKLVRKILGFKSVPPEQWTFPGRMSKTKQALSKALFPPYAFFLLVWQVYVCPNNRIKKNLKKLLLLECEESNYVLRGLLGEKVITQKLIDTYQSRGLRWTNRLDESCLLSLNPLTQEEKQFNDLDLDLLKYVRSLYTFK